MKMIAITQRLIENDTYLETRDCLDVKWGSFLDALDCLPIVLPTYFDFKKYFNEINISGIILSGGNNLASVSKIKIDKTRDDFERNLIAYAIKHNIPILGVCRGMQLIGEYFGMRLKRIENHTGVVHKITVNKLPHFADKLGEDIEVNSYHNYGFKELSYDFELIAHSDDGVIESIIHKNYPVFAIMWHPEREDSFSASDLNLISGFFNL